ncbi:hypothetical protein ACFWNG_26715 [Streptomyces sp. NPDC058391]|uniref:hypothetical protein n=1 Tax=Streptomyces sp. NPDC058391 TaxID=3346476 RepID=UPI00365D6D6B
MSHHSLPARVHRLAAPRPAPSPDLGAYLASGVVTGALMGGVWGLVWSLHRAVTADAATTPWLISAAQVFTHEAAVIVASGPLGALVTLGSAGTDRVLRPLGRRFPKATTAVALLPALVVAVAAMETAARVVPVRSAGEEALRLLVPLLAAAGLFSIRAKASHRGTAL